MAQPDPQMALQMAQQEMEYRVELFNKWAFGSASHIVCRQTSGLFSLVIALIFHKYHLIVQNGI